MGLFWAGKATTWYNNDKQQFKQLGDDQIGQLLDDPIGGWW